MEEVFDRLRDAVVEGDVEKARSLANEALSMGVNPLDAIELGLARGVRIIGDRFGGHEAFLTELILAGEAMKAGCEVLREAIPKKTERRVRARVVIGTVKDDIHFIGKDIVATMLEASGFEIHNLGEDVPTEAFVRKVKELRPDVLALSALMTVTMPRMKEVIDALKATGLRSKVKVFLGGAPTTQEWAREIGADGWAEDAASATRKLESMFPQV